MGRSLRLSLASWLAVVFGAAVGLDAATTTASPAAAVAGPTCTFGGAIFGAIVPRVHPGKRIHITCTNMGASHPYLLMETSLTLALDPQAQPLLTGSVTSVPGLLALVAALPEINGGSLAFPISDASGELSYDYTIPSTQPIAPQATCPPSKEEFNSGLIGCAVAMIDLTTFKPVPAGSFVIQFKHENLLPPPPTLAVSPTTAASGQTVTVTDTPNAKTFWWLPTLVALSALLGTGSSVAPVISAQVGATNASQNISVTGASYNSVLVLDSFTPPKLKGSFVVPAGIHGTQEVAVVYSATLLGLTVPLTAKTTIEVS